MCIEDPFETSHDLGRTVGPAGADRLKAEFRAAWRVLQDSPSMGEALRLFDPVPDERPLSDLGQPAGGRGGGRQSGGSFGGTSGAPGGGRGGRSGGSGRRGGGTPVGGRR